ncbi:MAG: nucleosidase [Gammaproteobacteria bacterium]
MLGVVAALDSEARTLGNARLRHDGLSCLEHGELLAVSGMGAARAAIAARSLADAGAARLLSFGMAGGLDPRLSAGSVVLPTEVISLGGIRFATSAHWREQLILAIPGPQPPAAGALFSSTIPVDGIADKAALFHETGAVAVDMESVGVAEVAAARGLPFMAVRVIVDTAADALPRVVMAASRGGQVNIRRLIGGLAVAPSELVAMIRLAQRYRAALRSLRAVGRVAFKAPDLADFRVA